MTKSTFWRGAAATFLLAIGGVPAHAQRLELRNAALAYPNPAFPYFHFRIELDLPSSTYLEVQASLGGQQMRYLTLKDASSPLDLGRTMIHYRPPFADTYTTNSTQFKKPYIVGWLAWQAGKSYTIDVAARLKEALKPSDADVLLTGSVTLAAPSGAKTFDPAWRNFKSLVLTETAGVERKGEPVDVVLAFYADEAQTLKNDLRVFAIDPENHAMREVPSQAYDIVHDVVEADPRDPRASLFARSTFDVPIWVPTTTARVAFQADVPARRSRIYLIYHNRLCS